MSTVPAILALMLAISAVSPALGARKTVRRARQSQAAPPAGAHPPQPLQRYALFAIDAMGRPLMGPAVPPPPPPPIMAPRPAPLRPMLMPHHPLPPPPPPQVIHLPVPAPRPPPRVIVQAAPPVQPPVVYVTPPPQPFECGAPKQPGECCDPTACAPVFHVDEEDLTCAHKGPFAVCCAIGHCD